MASAKLASAMREVHNNVPKNVRKTGKTGAAKEAMLRAIAFSKARAAGARIPQQGGSTPLAADSMKMCALKGREDNLSNKSAFKKGPLARIGPDSGSTCRVDTAAAEEVKSDGR